VKKDNFKNKTTGQLKISLRVIKIITIALICVITLLLSITIYGMATKEDIGTFIAPFVVGISCSGILPLQFMLMTRIKSELASRA
tara:strand:+ start:133 stop:387 length:255 start_codon:yes stop_codon:yes gene_type:complete